MSEMMGEMLGGDEFFVGDDSHQMYVQRWRPRASQRNTSAARPFPLVLVHGGLLTGVSWTSTPDGRPGWAPYLSGQGWEVYVVDWPGMGRSGFSPDLLKMSAAAVIQALRNLLSKIGPAGLIGHSMGTSMLFRLADESMDQIKAILALTSGPIGNVGFAYDLLPDDVAWFPSRQFAENLLMYSERFPSEAGDNFYKSLVPMSPNIVNQMGHRGHPGLEINRPQELHKLPILFVSSEDDKVSANSMTQETASVLGARHLYLGADWELPGFGHMVPIERGTLDVAARVSDWFQSLSS